MNFYYMIFATLSLFTLLEDTLRIKIFGFASCSLLAIVAGSRYFTGSDYLSYLKIYNGYVEQDQVEFGYHFFNNFFSNVGLPFNGFLFLYSCVTLMLLFLYLKNELPLVGASVLYYFSRYFFLRDMGQIRASLAAVICLFSIRYMREKKIWPFTAIILLAASIHSAAYVYFVVYVWCNYIDKKIEMKRTLMYIAGAAVLSTVTSVLFKGIIVSHFSRYASYVTNSAYTSGGGLTNSTIIVQLVIVIVWIIVRNYNNDKFLLNFDFEFKIYEVGLFILILCSNLPTVGGRISTLMSTLEIILVPILCYQIFYKYFRTFLFVILCAAMFFLIFINSGLYEVYVPYLAFW